MCQDPTFNEKLFNKISQDPTFNEKYLIKMCQDPTFDLVDSVCGRYGWNLQLAGTKHMHIKNTNNK